MLARVDVRLTLLLAGSTAAFTSLLLCGLLAHAVQEALEEQARVADDLVAAVTDAVARGVDVGTIHAGAAYRVSDAVGGLRVAGGPWPAENLIRRDIGVGSAIVARRDEFLVRERVQGEGLRIAAALPLRRFVRERAELVTRAGIVVLLGLFGSVALGIVSARRALRPLREITAAIRGIDPRRLGARVPERGTSDDVDRLAAATNEVLGRLEWAFGRLSGFSADVAHELRTPVNRVLNTAEVALTTTSDPEGKDDALATIHDTAEAMRRIIDQLLLLAKGEDGRLPLTRREVDLGALLRDLVELYAPEAERLGKRLEILPRSDVVVAADRELIERAVVNLLENALGHSAAGATVHVGIEAKGAQAVVVVEDSGPGIPEADRARVFERFVRLDAARAPGGVGLGLSIARMVARLHGGDLELGESVLGGASFRLFLPGLE